MGERNSKERGSLRGVGGTAGFFFFEGRLLGGGRIRDVASLIRRTDEPKIKFFFWGEKSKKTFSPEAKKIF